MTPDVPHTAQQSISRMGQMARHLPTVDSPTDFFRGYKKPSGFLESGHSNPGTCLCPSVDISVRKLEIMALVKAEERPAYLDLDNAVEVETKLTRALEAVQAHSDRLIAKKESGEIYQ